MNRQEIIANIALSKLKGLNLLNARTLVEAMGSASEVLAHRKDIVKMIPNVSQRLVEAFADVDVALKEAEQEMEFVEKKNLKVFTLMDEDYPGRLRECEDAPLVLFYCGSADLNSPHIINMVGTRKC